jgi:hypothetical protein
MKSPIIVNTLHNKLTLPTLLYRSENRTNKARDAIRIIAAEMKYMRTAEYTWTYHKINRHCKGIKYNPSFRKNTEL